jgi:hypothetical protein
MPFIEFIGQSRKDSDFQQASTSRLLNCYREPIEGGYVVKSVPGTSLVVNLGSVFMRAMEEVGGNIYAVCGGRLFRIISDGTATQIGAIADGPADISGNNGSVTIAAGGKYYVWDGSVLTSPTGGAFASVGSVEFVGQTTIMTEKGGRRFQWTGVAAPTSLNGLDFATAEGRDDNILRCVVINGNVWLFKEKSIEIWYPTTTGFSRIAGGVLDTGMKAFGLVAKFDGGALFVGDDNIAYITGGSGMEPVSTPAVETDIAQGSPVECLYYEDEGHKFCAIQFADRPAWVYDISTGEWHNRSAGVNYGAWPVVASVKAFGSWHVGGNTGNVLRLSRNNADFDGPLYRRGVSRTLRNGDRVRIPRFELYGRMGQGPVNGREPQISLRFSRDSAKTWGIERWRSFGATGDYDARIVLRSLGQFRSVTAEFTTTDPIEIPILANAFLELA